MADKYKDQFRVPSARLPHWDYGGNAAYFVTICTAGKTCYFGHVADGTMQLSALGQLAENHWREIPEQFPFTIPEIFVVMPNHLHGIIIIDKNKDCRDAIYRVSNAPINPEDAINPGDAINPADAINRVSTDTVHYAGIFTLISLPRIEFD